jgi:hypothetical protein
MFLITLCFVCVYNTSKILQYCELMEGIQLNDFILYLFKPHDFSNWICVLLVIVEIIRVG